MLRLNHPLLFGLIFIVLLLILISTNHVYAEVSSQDSSKSEAIPVPNPAADLWRAVRQREGSIQAASTQVKGVETGVLVTESGEKFRDIRRSKIVPYLPFVLLAVLGSIVLYYFIRGVIKVEGGLKGTSVQRFKDIERMAHWFVAVIFIFLALTGLILLFGRFVLLPIFGKEVFGLIASACKEGHNLIGPLFPFGLILLFILFIRENIPHKGDLKWILKGGGFGKQHVRADFFNSGEKIWFWLVIILGLTASATGLILDFPIFEQGRGAMQLSLIIHGVVAVIFIAIALGHIYLASIGTEGTLSGMTTGRVDVNWAKTHHDAWLEKVSDSEIVTEVAEPVSEKLGGETTPVHT